MASPGYDKSYATSRVADIDAQIEAVDGERARLLEQRGRYAPNPPTRSNKRKSDEG